jgi:maleate isomerase
MTWRVGLLIPSSNAVMEVDFYRNLPHDTTLHTGRMFLDDASTRCQEQMLDRFLMAAASALGTVRPDIVVFDSANAVELRGKEYERRLGERIGEVTGAITISVRGAVIEALRAARASGVAVVTPGADHPNRRMRADLEAEGMTVTALHGMGLSILESASVTPEAVYSFVQSCIGPRVPGDVLFLADTNFQAMGALSLLKITYDVPIVTSNLATLQAVKQHVENLRERAMARLSS